MEKNFIRVRSTKDITICASLVILGAVLVALPTATSINVIGFFMIFTGIILALILRSGYKDTQTGEKFAKAERFFAQSMKHEITSALASKPDSVNLAEEDKGNGVRLDIYYSKNTGKAYLQLFEYIPYKYEPCTSVYEHELSNVTKLIK